MGDKNDFFFQTLIMTVTIIIRKSILRQNGENCKRLKITRNKLIRYFMCGFVTLEIYRFLTLTQLFFFLYNIDIVLLFGSFGCVFVFFVELRFRLKL